MCAVQNFLHSGTGLSAQGYLVGFCIRKEAIAQHLRHYFIDSMASPMLPLPLVKNCRTNSFGSSAFFFGVVTSDSFAWQACLAVRLRLTWEFG
jgi:hypothetical protein